MRVNRAFASYTILASIAMLDLELTFPILMLLGLWQLVFQQPSNSNQFGFNRLLQKSLMLLPLFSKSLAATQASYFEKHRWGTEVSINTMLTLPTGGHIIAGRILANDNQQPLLAHFSALGETLWVFRFNNTGAFYSLLDSSEGKFLVGGKLILPQFDKQYASGILLEIDSVQPSISRAVSVSTMASTSEGYTSVAISDMARDNQGNLIVAGGEIIDTGPVRITKLSPDWKMLNTVNYNGPGGESVTNLAISNQTIYVNVLRYRQDGSYLLKLNPNLTQLQILHNGGDIHYFVPHPWGGSVALIEFDIPNLWTEFLVFYGDDGKILWHHDLGGMDYHDFGDNILFDNDTGDILLLSNWNDQVTIFSMTGQLINLIKIADPVEDFPRAMTYSNDKTMTFVGVHNYSNGYRVNGTYLLQLSPQELVDNCTRVIYGLATLKKAANTTMLQHTDATATSPFNRTDITAQTVITDVLSFVKNLLVPIQPQQEALCAGNKASFFPSTMTGAKQTTAKSENVTNTTQPTSYSGAASTTIIINGVTQINLATSSPDTANNTLLLSYVLGSLGSAGIIFGCVMLAVYLHRKSQTDTFSAQAMENPQANAVVKPPSEYGAVNPQSTITVGYQAVIARNPYQQYNHVPSNLASQPSDYEKHFPAIQPDDGRQYNQVSLGTLNREVDEYNRKNNYDDITNVAPPAMTQH